MTTTCRDEVLAAMARLRVRTGESEFRLVDVVAEGQSTTGHFAESTIRTHIVSRLCSNSPDHHAVSFRDVERVDRDIYRLRSSGK